MKILILNNDKEIVEKVAECLKSNLQSQIDFTDEEKEVISKILVVLKINITIKQI